jgi:hypothetical protein
MELMILAAVILALTQILTGILVCWWIRRTIAAKQAEISQIWLDLIEQPDPTKPSRLALFVDTCGATIGSAAARSIMATLSTADGHAARAANTASDLIQAQNNPIMALLQGGKRGKGAAVMRLAELLGPMLMGKNGTPPTPPEDRRGE